MSRKKIREALEGQQYRHSKEIRELRDEWLKREARLIDLGLLPDEYLSSHMTGVGVRRWVDWDKIGRAVKDLETYRAAERGKEIASERQDESQQ